MSRKLFFVALAAMLVAACSQSSSPESDPAAVAETPAADETSSGIEMRPRPEDPADFPEYVEYLVEVSYPRTDEQRAQDAPIQAKFEGQHNIDSIVIAAPGFPADITLEQYEEYMEHFIENNFTSMSVTVSNGSDDSVEQVFERVETFNQYIAERQDRYMQIRAFGDFEKAMAEGRLGQFYNFQSMNAFGEDVANVEKYYNLGLRTANFTYNQDNAFGGGTVSNEDGSNDGVTALGKEVIAEMNRVGMVIDCSHSSDQTCLDAASLTTKPMIMSHSNSSALHSIGRNNSDEAMLAVAGTGGAICINFIGGFLNTEGDARPAAIAEHIQHVANLTSKENVCAGSDYVYNYAGTLMWVLQNPEQFPPSMGYATPSHMGMPGEIWGVVRYLQENNGWTDEEIIGLTGGNLLRVYEANWE
ncbi:MAG: dipeptidase [Woeseiaceae bacterium]